MSARLLLFAAAMTCLSGCATRGISTALDELGSEQRTDFSSQGMRSKRAMNLTGIGGPETLGMLVTDPDPSMFSWLRSPFGSDVLPDTVAVRVSTHCSKVAVQVYGSEFSAREFAARPVDARAVAAGGQPPAHSEFDRVPPELMDLRDTLDQIANLLLQRAALSVETQFLSRLLADLRSATDDAAREAVRERARRLLGASAPQSDGEFVASLQSTAAQVHTLDKQVAAHEATAARLRKHWGVVITRWTVGNQGGFKGWLGDVLGFDAHSSSRRSGFLMLAGLRVATLIVGDDFWERHAAANDGSRTGADAIFDGYVVTHQLGVRHWAYTEAVDVSSYLRARFEVDKLGGLVDGGLKDMLKQAKAGFEAEVARTLSAANAGAFTAPRRSAYEFRFSGDTAYMESVLAEARRGQGYKTIYSVRTSLDSVRPANGNGSRPGSSCSMPTGRSHTLVRRVDASGLRLCRGAGDDQCVNFDDDLLTLPGRVPEPVLAEALKAPSPSLAASAPGYTGGASAQDGPEPE